jgi:flagellar basal body P-ring protein FlgI
MTLAAARSCRPSVRTLAAICLAVAGALGGVAALVGCSEQKSPKPVVRYATLPPKPVPAYMKNTIFERVDMVDAEPLPLSGYGIVARLKGTGDNKLLPTAVREYVIKEMVRKGIGSKLMPPPYDSMSPEEMLRDPTIAVVRVDGFLPPGARKGDMFDVQVSALPESDTSSLQHGMLWRTELKRNGANMIEPGYEIAIPAYAQGPIFVNPAYALGTASTQGGEATKASTAMRNSLRYGVVQAGQFNDDFSGARAMDYRPLLLRLRQPQRALARGIEVLIEQRFATYKEQSAEKIAAAKDEALVLVQVPASYNGDWQHFSGVFLHMYLDSRPEFLALRSKQLAEEAVKPDAKLEDISYCFEAIDKPALPFLTPLMTNADPAVAFAATRAAAYIGDPAAQDVLVRIASTKDHPFQINAVQVLGDLPKSPAVVAQLHTLLDSDQTLVRIEAYRQLARNFVPGRDADSQHSAPFYSKMIGDKFVLDIVPSNGTPLIYATRRGIPRVAIIGGKPSLNLPIMFSAMDDQLTISSAADRKTVKIYYRGPELRKPVTIASNADVAELVARMGGEGPVGQPALSFSYGDIVAMLQSMADAQQLSGWASGQRVPAAFVLQGVPKLEQTIYGAPVIPDARRPQKTSETSSAAGTQGPVSSSAGEGSRMNPADATLAAPR